LENWVQIAKFLACLIMGAAPIGAAVFAYIQSSVAGMVIFGFFGLFNLYMIISGKYRNL
jgi:hypothetical protein